MKRYSLFQKNLQSHSHLSALEIYTQKLKRWNIERSKCWRRSKKVLNKTIWSRSSRDRLVSLTFHPHREIWIPLVFIQMKVPIIDTIGNNYLQSNPLKHLTHQIRDCLHKRLFKIMMKLLTATIVFQSLLRMPSHLATSMNSPLSLHNVRNHLFH